MPRFYFDVREGAKFIPDEEGLEFDSFEVAEREAATAAAEIGRDYLPKGDAREVTVEVKNEHRQRVLIVKVSMDIDRVEPPPQPRAGETIVCGFPIMLFLTRLGAQASGLRRSGGEDNRICEVCRLTPAAISIQDGVQQ